MMNSRRICPTDGSKDSAVGLVFMESAAGLAMETSKVVVLERALILKHMCKLNQLEQELRVAILITVDESVDSRYSRRLLMSNVEQEADTSKRNSEEGDVVLKNQQMTQQMVLATMIQQKRKVKDSAVGLASNRYVIISIEEADGSNRDVIISIEEADGSNRDVIISIEEADGSNRDVIISIEEADGSNRDVIISIEEADGSNRDVIISIIEADEE
ncbi:hypothetical protein F511_35896 [Dorcoceras hygrometricum]|uniref:Uncharacterized protein n=1 Tax=Dorcoceras hygrometricum TaxID=472368 RepID=A0A2Z7C0X7_9LAMI|nr:hypothetical protein F511_35896 [Dorcoceras hygrometricum]